MEDLSNSGDESDGRLQADRQVAEEKQRPAAPWVLLIVVGAALFMVALIGSAAVVPQLRVLHVLQSMIYVVVVALALRGDTIGFGAGVSVPVVWNALQLFVTGLMRVGATEFVTMLRGDHVMRVDTMFVFVGSIGHFLLIIGCIGAFLSVRPLARSWKRFTFGMAVSLAYLAAIVVVARPR